MKGVELIKPETRRIIATVPGWRGDADRWPRTVIVIVAVRNDHVQRVRGTAQEDDNQGSLIRYLGCRVGSDQQLANKSPA